MTLHLVEGTECRLHALAAGARDRLALEFGAPHGAPGDPLIRRPDDEDTFSMLMPVRPGD